MIGLRLHPEVVANEVDHSNGCNTEPMTDLGATPQSTALTGGPLRRFCVLTEKCGHRVLGHVTSICRFQTFRGEISYQ